MKQAEGGILIFRPKGPDRDKVLRLLKAHTEGKVKNEKLKGELLHWVTEDEYVILDSWLPTEKDLDDEAEVDEIDPDDYPDERAQAYKLCSSEGCTNKARKGGVCMKHGAKVKRCSSEGCTNYAVKGGVCMKHGAKVKRCSSEGCTNYAVKGGVCMKHGAKVKRCSSEGCTNYAVKGGVCKRHGAKVTHKQVSQKRKRGKDDDDNGEGGNSNKTTAKKKK